MKEEIVSGTVGMRQKPTKIMKDVLTDVIVTTEGVRLNVKMNVENGNVPSIYLHPN